MNGSTLMIIGIALIALGIILSAINIIYGKTKAKSIKKALSDDYDFGQ
ncbi:MAG: hypothetical protein MJ133_07990 [Lachnospiraceae bacterium]|nr:hypothetical protein [Lachnospiraceae bacterium]